MDNSSIKKEEKVSCYTELKKIFKFPDLPNVTIFLHKVKEDISTKLFSSANENIQPQVDISAAAGNEPQNMDSFQSIDNSMDTTTDSSETGQSEIDSNISIQIVTNFDVSFLKNGQSNDIHPQFVLNHKPKQNVSSNIDLNACIIGRIFDGNGLDFDNFIWKQGEPESTLSKLLSDLNIIVEESDSLVDLFDDPSSIGDCINGLDYYLKKWSGEIASYLQYLFPYDIPMDICIVVASKFSAKFKNVNLCWKLLIFKFSKYNLGFSCFEVSY